VAGVGLALGAGLVCVLLVVFVVPFSPDIVTRFVSPSGRRVIVVTESCFIKGCSNRAELEGRWRNEPLGSAEVAGDPEGPAFPGATVTWNADETRAIWQTHTRHGGARGVWVLEPASAK
jgi:hypothetical protein